MAGTPGRPDVSVKEFSAALDLEPGAGHRVRRRDLRLRRQQRPDDRGGRAHGQGGAAVPRSGRSPWRTVRNPRKPGSPRRWFRSWRSSGCRCSRARLDRFPQPRSRYPAQDVVLGWAGSRLRASLDLALQATVAAPAGSSGGAVVRDFYKVLGIASTADDRRIKTAFRRRAKAFHPDLNPGDRRAEERFKELTEAYEVLRSAHARATYDAYRAQRRSAARRRVAGSAALMAASFVLTLGSAFAVLAVTTPASPSATAGSCPSSLRGSVDSVQPARATAVPTNGRKATSVGLRPGYLGRPRSPRGRRPRGRVQSRWQDGKCRRTSEPSAAVRGKAERSPPRPRREKKVAAASRRRRDQRPVDRRAQGGGPAVGRRHRR